MEVNAISYSITRQVGHLPQNLVPQKPSQTKFWKNFKKVHSSTHTGPIVDLEFSPSDPHGLYLAASSRVSLKTISIKDATDESSVKNICQMKDNVQCVAVRSDGKLIAMAGASGDIIIMDPLTRNVLRTLSGHKATISSLTFFANNTYLVSTGDDNSIHVWDITTGLSFWSNSSHSSDFIRSSCICSDKRLFLTASYDHKASLWSLDNPDEPLLTLNHGAPIENVSCFSSDGFIITSGGTSSKIWSLSKSLNGNYNGSLVKDITLHHKAISCIRISNDEKYLISASIDQSVKVLHLASFEISGQFKFKSAVFSMALSKNSQRIAVGLSNGNLVILDFLTPSSCKKIPTRTFYSLNPEQNSSSDFYELTKSQHSKLNKFDFHMKSFRYIAALDSVIKYKSVSCFATAVSELIRRDSLEMALSSRCIEDIINIVQIIVKGISSTRYNSILINVAYMIFDLYGETAKNSFELKNALIALKDSIDLYLRIQKGFVALSGQIETFCK